MPGDLNRGSPVEIEKLTIPGGVPRGYELIGARSEDVSICTRIALGILWIISDSLKSSHILF